MISLTQRKHWLPAAVISLGLMAACSLQAAETPVAAISTPAISTPAIGGTPASMTPTDGVDSGVIEGGEGKRMCKGHMSNRMKEKVEDRHDKLADDLKLDDKQRQLFDTAMKQMRDCMHGGRDLHEQLKTVVESDQYDEKKVRDIVRKHNADMEEQAVASSKAMHAFYQSLGPWQKGKFKAIKDEMHGKMKEHMKHKLGAGMDSSGEPAAEEGAEHSHDHSGKTE